MCDPREEERAMSALPSLRSCFNIRHPGPASMIDLNTALIFVMSMKISSRMDWGMPSLKLYPGGEERSLMSLNTEK